MEKYLNFSEFENQVIFEDHVFVQRKKADEPEKPRPNRKVAKGDYDTILKGLQKSHLKGDFSLWGTTIMYDSEKGEEITVLKFEKEWRDKNKNKNLINNVFVIFPEEGNEKCFNVTQIDELVEYIIKNLK